MWRFIHCNLISLIQKYTPTILQKYNAYFLKLSENRNLRKDISITAIDRIMTLITCIREQPEKRVYVQVVLQQSE